MVLLNRNANTGLPFKNILNLKFSDKVPFENCFFINKSFYKTLQKIF